MSSRGINKVILIGFLGQDPEVKYMPSGGAVANLSLATSEQWKDKDTGEQKTRTEWHKIVIYGRLGEIAGEYLRKGSQVYIEGRLQTRKWQDKSGQDKYTTEIIANEMQMLGGGGGRGGAMNAESDFSAGNKGGANNTPSGMPSAPEEFDDDIPF